MKIIKVVYNNDSKDILNIINNLDIKYILDTYNIDIYKDRRKAYPILCRFGTKNVPLIVFADENQTEYAAIWPESKTKITTDLLKKYLTNETIL